MQLQASGDFEGARRVLAGLREEWPENIPVGRWLQEVELELGRRSRPAGEARGNVDSADALRRAYRERADVDPTPASLVLAARLEDDPPSALHLLQQALELDPRCAWAHYGRAFVQASIGRWEEARAELDAAIEADPALLPTLRLHAWLLARAGKRPEAIAVLAAWLEHAADDSRFLDPARDEARLDLALLLLGEGRPAEALAQLEALRPGSVQGVRLLAAQAAVENALGEQSAARESTRAAQRSDPLALLPVVQEALLLEYWLNDPSEAERAWRRVLELAGNTEELTGLVQRMRAQVHLSRLGRRTGSAP